jgi:hypothetical protein
MIVRTSTGVAGALALLLCAACASAPDQSSEYKEQKIYRTGSNIPAKDYGSAAIEVRGPEVINPINRPMPSVMTKKPAH